MKKQLALFLTLMMLLSLAACGGSTEAPEAEQPQTEKAPEQEIPAEIPEEEIEPEPVVMAPADLLAWMGEKIDETAPLLENMVLQDTSDKPVVRYSNGAVTVETEGEQPEIAAIQLTGEAEQSIGGVRWGMDLGQAMQCLQENGYIETGSSICANGSVWKIFSREAGPEIYLLCTQDAEPAIRMITAGKPAYSIRISKRAADSISAGLAHTVALQEDGTVLAAGNNRKGQCEVSDWTEITAVSAGLQHTVGLRADGTVAAVGDNEEGQCEVGEWKDIVAISAGGHHTVGLKADGTVVAVGRTEEGQCLVGNWKNITAICAGTDSTMGLRRDGSVICTGWNEAAMVRSYQYWDHVTAMDAGNDSYYCWTSDGTLLTEWNQVQEDNLAAYSAGDRHVVGIRPDGTVFADGCNDQGQCDVGDWTEIVAVSAGYSHTVGLKADGTVVSTGSNASGQCELQDWSEIRTWQEQAPVELEKLVSEEKTVPEEEPESAAEMPVLPDKEDLGGYDRRNINELMKKIPDMRGHSTERRRTYTNGSVAIQALPHEAWIIGMSLLEPCDYSICGLTCGMSLEDAIAVMQATNRCLLYKAPEEGLYLFEYDADGAMVVLHTSIHPDGTERVDQVDVSRLQSGGPEIDENGEPVVPFSEPIWMTERSGDLSRYFGTDLETAASQIAHMMDMGYAMQERFITNGVVGLLANSQDDRIFRITLDRDGPYLDLFEPTEYWYEIAGIHLGMTAERAKRVLEQAGYPIVEEQTDPVQGMYVYAFTEDSYLRFRVEQTEGQQTVISVSLEKREVQ